MKIHYVLNARWPTVKAHGLQVAKMCEAFQARGVDIELIVPERRAHPQVGGQNPWEYFGVQRFPVRYLASPDWVHAGIIGRILFVLQQTLFALRVRIYLIRQPGIVYTRDAITALVCIMTGRAPFLEIHDVPRTKGIFWRFAVRHSGGVVAITGALREEVLNTVARVNRVIVAPDGYDPEQFKNLPDKAEARRKVHLPEGVPITLYSGHLYAWKGVDTLAMAAPQIYGVIVFVGGTDGDIARMRALYGATPNIVFVGHRPHSEISLWLRAADVLVLPNSAKETISEKYTSPLKMFEYMASGTPIVASDLPSIREILSNENAVFVMPDSPDSLVQGVASALRDESRAAHARSSVADYSWSRRAGRILAFIGV